MKDIVDEFKLSVNRFTLKFVDAEYEQQYLKLRLSIFQRSPFMKTVIILFFAVLSFKSLVMLVGPTFGESKHGNKSFLVVSFITWAISIVGELISSCFIPYLKGVFLLLKSFFAVAYVMANELKKSPSLPVGAIAVYTASVVIGSKYTYSWMISTLTYLFGITTSIIFLHSNEYKTIDVLANDLVFITAFTVMTMLSYEQEYDDRLNFYMINRSHEAHIQNLLKRIPNGVVILNSNLEPEFANDCIKRMFVKSKDSDISFHSLMSIEDSMLKQEDIMELLEEIKGSTGNLRTYIQNSPDSLPNESLILFKHENNEKEYQYALKQITLDFNKQKCKVIILDDYTPFIELARLEEKYQKIFLASVVHDIRTPVQGVLGVLDILDTSDRTESEREFIELGKNTCSLLNFLTYDITDLGQIEANKLKIVHTHFSALEVIEECMKIVSFGYKKKQLYLTKVFEPRMIYDVISDKHRYTQVLINLLGNALKFTFSGGVKIILSINEEEDLLFTEVQDTGIGIPPEEIKNLFKMFGKLTSSESVNPQGVGLGLTICKKLCEAMGGTIYAKSIYGTGTSFIFSIKINTDKMLSGERLGTGYYFEEEKEITSRSVSNQILQHIFLEEEEKKYQCINTAVPLMKKYKTQNCDCSKVLVVDDNPSVLFVMKAYLSSMRIKADEALNGEEAVNKIINKSKSECCRTYKIVLMDLNMPIMNGIEAAKKISMLVEEGHLPPTPLVALTGGLLDREEEYHLLNEIGFSCYYSKPLPKKDLQVILAKYGIEQRKDSHCIQTT